MEGINWLAAVAAGILGFFPGAVWYSPLMFLKPWQADAGISGHGGGMGMAARLGLGLLMSLIAALLFAMLVGPNPTLFHSVKFGLVVGVGFITTAFAIQYLFEGKTLRLTLINGGYHTVQFLIYGIVIGLWPS
jgi:hypothetical protein